MVRLRLAVLSVLELAHHHLVNASPLDKRLNNGIGATPALGWNNWNLGGGSSLSLL